MIFQDIVTIDYKRPLAERAKSRKSVGPYHWAPRDAAKSDGFAFYCASGKGLAMDRHGSICDLRLEYANDLLPGYSRLARINGYYCDTFQDETLVPIVARLPHARGFLAGWTLGAGCCAELSIYVFDSPEDAAISAHDEAERAGQRWIEAAERDNAQEEED